MRCGERAGHNLSIYKAIGKFAKMFNFPFKQPCFTVLLTAKDSVHLLLKEMIYSRLDCFSESQSQ